MTRVLGAGLIAFVATLGCSAAAGAISVDGGSESGAVDARASQADTEIAATPDLAVDAAPDGGPDGSSTTLACPPGDVSGFTPTWKPPKPLHANKCSVAQANLAIDCAFDPSSKQNVCDEFFADAGNSDCMLCVLTDDFDTTYGPVVMQGAYAVLNLAGCIAHLAADTTATGCGAKVQAISECQEAACSSCPDPSTIAQALAEYSECQRAATASVCAPYVSAGSCADPLIAPDGSAEACASGSNTFLDRARRLARLFCGAL